MNNPQRPTDAGCVEQYDLDAATPWLFADPTQVTASNPLVQAFARHRLAALSASGGDAAELAAADDDCPDGAHCCCCGAGDVCCDCGAIMPDREELPALRNALRQLLEACQLADAKEDLSLDIDGTLLDAASEALELQFPIIWTAEQVAMLEERQSDPMAHPYTCGNDRADPAHVAVAEEACEEPGLLFPTRRGWRCPACDYRQFWSHETGGPAALPLAKQEPQG